MTPAITALEREIEQVSRDCDRVLDTVRHMTNCLKEAEARYAKLQANRDALQKAIDTLRREIGD